MPRPMDIIDPKRDLDKVEEKDFDLSSKKKDESKENFEIEESKGGGTFYLILGIIALVVATGFALYILYKDDSPKKQKTASTSASVTPTPEASESATATATASVQTSSTALPIGSPSQTKTSFSGMSVRVANGNSKAGEASRIKTLLESKGFSVTSVGNATKTYEDTVIFYKTGKEDLAKALSEAIKGEYSATLKLSDETVGSYDAVIALGKK